MHSLDEKNRCAERAVLVDGGDAYAEYEKRTLRKYRFQGRIGPEPGRDQKT